MPVDQGLRRQRVRAAVVATMAVGAVLVPLTRELDEDSFPLSNYPMFTARRPAVTSIERAIGLGADGAEHVLAPELVGGTVEVIQAAQTIYDAIGDGTTGALCLEIAARAAGSDDSVEVLVVSERYDVVAALGEHDPAPLERRVHARCPVPQAPD